VGLTNLFLGNFFHWSYLYLAFRVSFAIILTAVSWLILACPSPRCSLIFSGVGQIPPATAINYVPWAIIGFCFQYVVRRKHFSYWAKYNCMSSPIPCALTLSDGCSTDVLSAALDAGTAVGVILVFFWWVQPIFNVHSQTMIYSLQYPHDGSIGRNTIQRWYVSSHHLLSSLFIGAQCHKNRWGNRVYMDTLDWHKTPLRKLSPGTTFGYVIHWINLSYARLRRWWILGQKNGR